MCEKLGFFTVTFLLSLNLAMGRENGFVSYDRYRIYEVSGSEPSFSALGSFETVFRKRKFNPTGEFQGVASYLVSPDEEPEFLKALAADGTFNYNLTISDLGKLIEEERNFEGFRRTGDTVPFTESYHSYDEIVDFLFGLTEVENEETSQPLAVLENIGKTFENRDTYMVKVSGNHSAEKPALLIEAGIHAREWLAPATAIYILEQLVRNYTHHKALLDDVDFYIIPVSNPDGYEFSRNYDRMWRKTRSIHECSRGVDGNRNFDFHWSGRGASDYPWSETYRGPKPFSEVETRNMRDVGIKYGDTINMYIALHAYGPYILYPWSYALTAPAPQHEILDMIAKDAAQAIYDFSKTEYEVGCSAKLLYDSPGSSDDYFKGVLGVDLAFTLEVSSAEEYSFVVPPSKILGVAKEVFEGVKVMADYAASYKKKKSGIEN